MTDRTLPKTTGKSNRSAEKKPEKQSPLLYSCRDAADACAVSLRTWRSWNALGFVPRPVAIGNSIFWRVDELAQWIEADCPTREEWHYRPEKRNFQKSGPFAAGPG